MEYTDIRYSDITTCIDSVSARAAQLEDGWSPNELCEGEQSHAYIIKHPISTQLTPCDRIHSHQVQWHYYVYWFCECQSWRTGTDGLQMELVWGRAVSCLHNQAPNLNTQLTSCDGIHWHQVQWHSYVYWFCECQSWRTGGPMVSKWIVWGTQSHAYIIKHPIETQLTPCHGIHWHQVQWHYYLYWFCESRAAQLEDGCIQMIVWGEQSHAYIIKHPIETQLTPCDGIHSQSGTVTLLRVWFCECQSWRTGGRMVSKWIVWGRAVSAYIIKHPIETQLTSCWWNTLTSSTVTLLRVLFCECQSSTTGGWMVFKWIVWGRSSLMIT